jgi:hypothetical protein
MSLQSTDSSGARSPISERVRSRVAAASADLEQGGTAPTEDAALRRVFNDMGRAQRALRRTTGQPPVPSVRTAALEFGRAPSLATLTGVAATLDEANLLGW